MGSYLGTLHVPATAGSLLVALGGVHWTLGAAELNQGLYVSFAGFLCRIVVAGALLQAAVVPSSAVPFDFQAEYRLTNQMVCVLSFMWFRLARSQPEPTDLAIPASLLFPTLDVGGGSAGQEQ